MKCNDIKIELSPYISGELTPQQEQEVAKHLETCGECKVKYEMIKRMGEIFKEEKKFVQMPNTLEQKLRKKVRKSRVNKVFKLSSLVAAILVFTIVTTATISPAFAQFISNIPGISYILESLSDNPTLQRAVKNDMIKPLNIVADAEDVGLRVEFEGYVADDRNIIIFYSVENLSQRPMKNVYIHAEKWKVVKTQTPSAVSGSYPIDNLRPRETKRSYLKILYGNEQYDTVLLDQILLELSVTSADGTWPLTDLAFSVDLQHFESYGETVIIDQEISVENQSIYLEKLAIKPTEAVLYFKSLETNSKEIFTVDLVLQDDKGNLYNQQRGTWFIQEGSLLMFESPIFVDYKELHLVGGTFNAINKEDSQVKIDLDNRKVLSGPKEIKIKEIRPSEDYLWIDLYCKEGTFLNINSPINGWGDGYDDDGKYYVRLGIEGYDDASGIVTLQLGSHPNTISQDFKIRIK